MELQNHQNYVNIGALNELKVQAREDQKAALKPVAEQFEALFVQQVFKESRKVKLDDGWLDGNQGDFYKDWHDKQLAQDLAAKGSLGFADKIVEQLLPSIPNLSANMEKENTDQQTQVENQAVQPPLSGQVQQGKSAPAQNNNTPTTQQVIAARPFSRD